MAQPDNGELIHGRGPYSPPPNREDFLRDEETQPSDAIAEVQEALKESDKEVDEDKVAIRAIVAHVRNGGEPPLTSQIEQRIRERNLMGRVFDEVGMGGPGHNILVDLTRRILDPEGKMRRPAGTTGPVSSPSRPPSQSPTRRYHRA